MAKTVVMDFDGVIHSYTSGWKGVEVIPDPPVEGIKEAITDIRKYYKVVVVSTRCFQEGGLEAVKSWLAKHEITVDEVLAHKPPAIVYVDDRALTFDGNAKGLLRKIKTFRTWQNR
jgi:predicted phosphatase